MPELRAAAAAFRVHRKHVPHAVVDLHRHVRAAFRRRVGHARAVAEDGLRGAHRDVQRRHVPAAEELRRREVGRRYRVGLQRRVVAHVLQRVARELGGVGRGDRLEDDVPYELLQGREVLEGLGRLDLGEGVGVVLRRVAHQVRPGAEEECTCEVPAAQQVRLGLQLHHERQRRASTRGVAADKQGHVVVVRAVLLRAVVCEPLQGGDRRLQDRVEGTDRYQRVVD
mmetsp:Transcript_33817/g.86672  ORF Transcript_33817/g.86672 Transcript_33817/m.86672 type:complete len:226 (+) Transcript_33817:948-1625(+)